MSCVSENGMFCRWKFTREIFSGSLYLNSGRIDPRVTPDIAEMYFQLRTPCSSRSVPIQKAAQILAAEEFDINKPVVLFISGWSSTIESDSIMHVAKAFNCRGGYNFLVFFFSLFLGFSLK